MPSTKTNPIQDLSLLPLTAEDAELVFRLSSSHKTLAEAIPDDMPEGDLWRYLSATCKELVRSRKAASALKLVIGRILLVIQERELWRSYGYKNWNSFMTIGGPELLGVPRSECYAAVKIVNRWPSLTPDEIQEVTYSKLSEISQFVEESSPNANEWLAAAQSNTLEELKDLIANKGIAPREDLDLCSIQILTSKGIKDMWTQMIQDGRVHSWCGSSNAGVIFERMIGEFWASLGNVEEPRVVEVEAQ